MADPNMISLKLFQAALDKAMEELPEFANDIKKRTALDILNRIVEKNPVDTGRARGNWQLSIGSPVDSEVSNAETLSPAQVIGNGDDAIASVKTGEDIWVSNNVPYIVALEEGHSQQAPQGMVALTLAEVGQGLEPL